jgi:pimeloyl-ACP methyl ester carboxylesterase
MNQNKRRDSRRELHCELRDEETLDPMRATRCYAAGDIGLEVIAKGRTGESHPVPLLFVHGALHAAWCWDEHFLDFFADKGYHALALSLRGHGRSPTSKPLRTCSIADYVEDLCSVANNLNATPVVIGHSMGGFIVQKYLETHDAPAGVLVASVPPRGHLGAVLRLVRRHPWRSARSLTSGKPSILFSTPESVRDNYFQAQTPESIVAHTAARLQEESPRAVGLDTTISNLVKFEDVTTPLLVLGAEEDGTYSHADVRATAVAYHTEAEFFPNMGHDMMLEPGWAAVADRIHTWLTAREL